MYFVSPCLALGSSHVLFYALFAAALDSKFKMNLAIIIILSTLTQFCIATAPSIACHTDNVLHALVEKSTDASSFCATYLGHSSLSASVILFDVTIVGGTFTQTYAPTEIATLFSVLGTKTIRTKTVTTAYAPQVPSHTALSTVFSLPTPEPFVATFPVSRISSACSCFIPPAAVRNIPVNVNCDSVPTQYVSTDTITQDTVFTAVGGKSTTIIEFSNTITLITSTQTVTLPFPTTCPLQANAQYVGSDGSPWFRSCGNSWGGSKTLKSIAARNLDECIDLCVEHNKDVKFVDCIGVSFAPGTSGAKGSCDLLSFVTFPNGFGDVEIAGLEFYQQPFPTLPAGFCESAVGSFLATATPLV
ncbi:hypothetical protein BGZ60DRAFT_547426 [Tricladium varicosporioides]|nr:hypothetical protein BGZ60DRAFT_547426 [Hymenoscyphus varicosporioides]